jgi:16S rRNA (guanine1516-N2)-methyltransferase
MSRYRLQRTASGLRLADTFSRQHPLHIDFASGQYSHRLRKGAGRQEMLVKATGFKHDQRVVDCTAGLGRDAFLMASLGSQVTMIERSPVMALLLEDALLRVRQHQDLLEVANRIQLMKGSALHLLGCLGYIPDVIMIDPMFPKRKKTAHVKGDMQVLQRFLGVDEDAGQLLQVAVATGCPRVVLKRPLHDKTPVGVTPSFTLKGKTVRFDTFVR